MISGFGWSRSDQGVMNPSERSALSLEGCPEQRILPPEPKACAPGPGVSMSQGEHVAG